jgi:hypothetical protein
MYIKTSIRTITIFSNSNTMKFIYKNIFHIIFNVNNKISIHTPIQSTNIKSLQIARSTEVAVLFKCILRLQIDSCETLRPAILP